MLNDDRVVVWFDIDNTLYPSSSRISQAMSDRIHAYFVNLGLSHEEATALHIQYYTQYGLALRGLIRHHDIDPLDFDRQCDGSLPLEDMIKFDPKLVKLFEDIDRTKARVWALTNAYKPHAQRVLRILQLDGLIDGLLYCNYQVKDFICKPEAEFYNLAIQQVGITDRSKCYFVDDSFRNVQAAHALGWGKCVHFCEKGHDLTVNGNLVNGLENGEMDSPIQRISSLEELRDIWPEIFKDYE
ncbi:hypothetical protein AMATHDRAFT_73928 [Amanita thiersii Skay4041]|uniref:Pyrimidine 5'-nucleotidase n=1 Tax=Amanita thiersii Skay4041 TaxID=703135 RepID=A0A2A9NY65_9AGAR|nr:hypothetical protein AMATHDRAFT_73928 [Amanita thiersii Skay4041]